MSQTLYVAANLTNLHREPSFHSELMTQVFNGMSMTVQKEEDKWVYVKLTHDGYEGWAYRLFLTEAAPAKPTHIVAGLNSAIYAETDAKAQAKSLLLSGTEISVVDQRDNWFRVQPAGQIVPGGWVQSDNLRPITFRPSEEQARKQLVADARKFMGIYYVWGGNSAFGTDCSGLMVILHRMIGRKIPRDARLQFPVGKEAKEPFQPGDLFFFRGDSTSDRITHVAMSTGGWNMIHSSRSRNGVYEEDLQQNEQYKPTFAGARSFLEF